MAGGVRRKIGWRVAVGAVLALAFGQTTLLSGPISPAYAANNTLTVVASGGSPENTGWKYASGVLTATTSVSVNASDIQAKLALGDLAVVADTIAVSSSIVAANANALVLRSTGNITVDSVVTISSQGGDITLQSDSDASGVGSIRLGRSADATAGTISSGGGDVTLSGGLDPTTGYAMASSDFVVSKPAAGVASFGFNVQAGGGAILVRGSSGPNGSISTRGILLESNAASRTVFETTATGTITMVGDGSQIATSNAWGMGMSGVTMRTVSGNISLSGKANTVPGNARGVTASNATFASTTGDISIDDTTNGGAANYTGMYVGGTLTDISTLGAITIRADEYISDGTLSFTGPSATLKPYTATSFTASLPVGRLTATNCQNLVIGQSGNTSGVTFAYPVAVGGPATVFGAAIAFNAAFSSSANLYIYGSGAVTQTGAITADGLALIGVGTYTLTNASNNVATLAAGSSSSPVGSVAYTDASGGLTVGQVSSLTGVYSLGAVNIATVSGDLSIAQPLSSIATSGDSIKLYANKPASSGTAGDGNLVLAGSGTIIVDPGARALLYSGTRTASTGLLAFVGGESNARSLIDATSVVSSITPALGSVGAYALFRTSLPMSYTVTFDGNGASSGTMSTQNDSGPAALNANSFSRAGYSFAGWNTLANGTGTPYADGATFAFGGSQTLYAQWTLVPTPTPTPTPTPSSTSNTSSALPITGVSLSAFVGVIAVALLSGVPLAVWPVLKRRREQS